MEKAIFLNDNHDIAKAVEALEMLKQTEFKLIVMVEKSGVAAPWFGKKLIDAFYYCPHDTECDCRKPKAGLFFEAARDLNLDLKHSWVMGETLDDIEAGNRAGCKTILIANGTETQWHVTPLRQPELLSTNFENAAGAVVLKSIYQMIREQQT
jgi:D-glycero-D-manno-heptose 1,7-bisphosphate phosphatase